MRCGLIGEHLGHSFSPQIHGEIADYSYELFELSPDRVEDFVRSCTLDAYNVTIPYKKTVMPFLDFISPEAQSIGAVNTVVRRDGRLYGYNTDYFGFCHMLDTLSLSVGGKKVLIFGTGGAAATVLSVMRDRGASKIISVSIENNNAEFLSSHRDAKIIVNATPVGMYPNNGKAPLSLADFPECEGVLDVIYNPAKTALLLDAEARGIKHINGLSMLVAQAVKACELFTGAVVDRAMCDKICAQIESDTKNIVLVGMPGCGKTSVGQILADMLGRTFYDADDIFTKTYEQTPAEVISSEGEETFRQMESKILCELGKLCSCVISTGGGAVTRERNYAYLHQNSTIIFLERALENLSKKGRPLSMSKSVETLYAERIDAYRRFADITVMSTEIKEKTAQLMIDMLGGQK